MLDSSGNELVIGAFYWVIPVLDADAEEDWELGMQPARYCGNSGWNYLAVDSCSFWPVRYIGARLEIPKT